MLSLINTLIRQLVGPSIQRPGHMNDGPFAETDKMLLHLIKQYQQGFTFDLIPALELADNQFRIKSDRQFGTTKPQGLLQADKQSFIFRYIIGASAEINGFGC